MGFVYTLCTYTLYTLFVTFSTSEISADSWKMFESTPHTLGIPVHLLSKKKHTDSVPKLKQYSRDLLKCFLVHVKDNDKYGQV